MFLAGWLAGLAGWLDLVFQCSKTWEHPKGRAVAPVTTFVPRWLAGLAGWLADWLAGSIWCHTAPKPGSTLRGELRPLQKPLFLVGWLTGLVGWLAGWIWFQNAPKPGSTLSGELLPLYRPLFLAGWAGPSTTLEGPIKTAMPHLTLSTVNRFSSVPSTAQTSNVVSIVSKRNWVLFGFNLFSHDLFK